MWKKEAKINVVIDCDASRSPPYLLTLRVYAISYNQGATPICLLRRVTSMLHLHCFFLTEQESSVFNVQIGYLQSSSIWRAGSEPKDCNSMNIVCSQVRLIIDECPSWEIRNLCGWCHEVVWKRNPQRILWRRLLQKIQMGRCPRVNVMRFDLREIEIDPPDGLWLKSKVDCHRLPPMIATIPLLSLSLSPFHSDPILTLPCFGVAKLKRAWCLIVLRTAKIVNVMFR